MEGRDAKIFLKTPLFRFKYMHEGEEKQLLDNAVRIRGKVVAEKSGGVVIRVEALSNLKQSESELPFKEIFIPFSKVDFIVII
jgi:hypothetical protein